MLALSVRAHARRWAKSGNFYGLFADCHGRPPKKNAIMKTP
jgi:hypothetical protein